MITKIPENHTDTTENPDFSTQNEWRGTLPCALP